MESRSGDWPISFDVGAHDPLQCSRSMSAPAVKRRTQSSEATHGRQNACKPLRQGNNLMRIRCLAAAGLMPPAARRRPSSSRSARSRPPSRPAPCRLALRHHPAQSAPNWEQRSPGRAAPPRIGTGLFPAGRPTASNALVLSTSRTAFTRTLGPLTSAASLGRTREVRAYHTAS